MDVRVAAVGLALVLLMPAAAVASQWLRRWWLVLGLFVLTAILSWWLLLRLRHVQGDLAVQAFNRIQNPTEQQIIEFQADGAANAFAFLFGVPAFLLYGGVCRLLIWVSRRVWKGLVHV